VQQLNRPLWKHGLRFGLQLRAGWMGDAATQQAQSQFEGWASAQYAWWSLAKAMANPEPMGWRARSMRYYEEEGVRRSATTETSDVTADRCINWLAIAGIQSKPEFHP
jgi:hypothetical protein